MFFHALARHSALRPDLIAAGIGGKTAVGVCAYAALLRGGAQAPETETRVSLQGLPVALEMSDKWIAFEEQQAAALGDAAAHWEVARKDVDRKEILRRFKERKEPVRGAVVDRTWDVRAEETRRLQLYKKRWNRRKRGKKRMHSQCLMRSICRRWIRSCERGWRRTVLGRHLTGWLPRHAARQGRRRDRPGKLDAR